MVTATCTWGEGPDVLVELKEDDFGAWLFDNPNHLDRSTYGFCKCIQFDLTAKEARELAAQLLASAQACDELEEGLEEYNK